jgi:hypothetical protein
MINNKPKIGLNKTKKKPKTVNKPKCNTNVNLPKSKQIRPRIKPHIFRRR